MKGVMLVLAGGLLFGWGLAVCGLSRQEAVLSFLRLEDLGLALTMLSAYVVTVPVYRLLPRRRGTPLIEGAEFAEFNRFLGQLKAIEESGRSLLDNTAVLFGSNLGNASAHDWHNLPIILAGGGYRHGEYVAHDEQNNTPLANLFVALARRMGLEIDCFGSSTSQSIRGLETA